MAGNGDYTEKAMQEHVKTYHGVLTMLKLLIGLSVAVLILLAIIYNA